MRLLVVLKRETAALKRLLQTRSLLEPAAVSSDRQSPGRNEHSAGALSTAIREAEQRISILKRAIQNGGYVATTDGFEDMEVRGGTSPEAARRLGPAAAGPDTYPSPVAAATAGAAQPSSSSSSKAVATGRKPASPSLPDVLLLPNIRTPAEDPAADSWRRPGAVSRGPIAQDDDPHPPSSPLSPSARRRPHSVHGSKARQFDMFHRAPEPVVDDVATALARQAAAAYPQASQQGRRGGGGGGVVAKVSEDLTLVDIICRGAKRTPYPCFSEQERAVFPERAPKPRRQKFHTVIVEDA
jgi:hypothetical protein